MKILMNFNTMAVIQSCRLEMAMNQPVKGQLEAPPREAADSLNFVITLPGKSRVYAHHRPTLLSMKAAATM